MMEETYLYQQIAENIRREILDGKFKPGDRLPSVRKMTEQWNCTIGTVQRAYQELARQGFIVSRSGQGTSVSDKPPKQEATPLRKAALVHRAENFLLEALTAGYTQSDIELAMSIALDRWRVITNEPAEILSETIRFLGSNDPIVTWIGDHFSEIAAGYAFQVSVKGSLGGLIALAEGKVDLAGSHLWDEITDTYNLPFVERLLPGKKTALVTLANRKLGIIVPPKNPLKIHSLKDLTKPNVQFINRQSGSGTRVWLDAQLHQAGILPSLIRGYSHEKSTHSEVAQEIADQTANVGIGLEYSASIYGLDFIFLKNEKYELVIPEEKFYHPAIQSLVHWLSTSQAAEVINHFKGYDASDSGKIRWSN
jgi:putative molybdopterin biosynthesis protein